MKYTPIEIMTVKEHENKIVSLFIGIIVVLCLVYYFLSR